jgi:outer membrane protein assembly factor BamB
MKRSPTALERRVLIGIILCLTFCYPSHFLAAQDWPQFRGPTGQGHSSVKRLPLRWSEDSDNIKWKSEIKGLGWSSPSVQGERIWLTTATDEGTSLRAICLDLNTGRTVHDVEVFRPEKPGRVHTKNSYSSPSPVIHGDRVFVHFGNLGTACLSTDGEIIWKTKMPYKHVHGPGGSPIVFEDLLILSCDGSDDQFVVALDQASGRERWRTKRPANPARKKFAFSTPTVITVDGRTQVVSAGAGNVASYDPASGRELWHSAYPEGYSVVPRPVFGHGMIFVSSSYNRPSLYAIKVDGKGDVTESHVAWSLDRGAPHNPSPLLVGDELYVVSDRGIATCVDARTGKQHWQERLSGNFSASPLYAADRIYFLDENGVTTVIKPGKTYQELEKNEVKGRTLASPTPVEGALLLRTDTHLYRIEAP